jgi:16S rRNA (cytosine1402-N4)-methyltransferase
MTLRGDKLQHSTAGEAVRLYFEAARDTLGPDEPEITGNWQLTTGNSVTPFALFLPSPTLTAMELPPSGHESVLLDEVIEALDLGPGKIIVDCTLGRGGHSSAILPRLGPDGLLLGLDADPRNLEFAKARLDSLTPSPGTPGKGRGEGDFDFQTAFDDRNHPHPGPVPEYRERGPEEPATARLFHANFSEIDDVLHLAQIEKVDGILADLGLSTNQLFDSHYGLSFAAPMPLDMRIDPRIRRTAADLVNHLPEEELANVLYNLADERYSRRIARKITEARRMSPIMTTDRLAQLVRDAIPHRYGPPDRIDPATRTFMALRMAVNDEVGNLTRLLEQAPKLLKPRGRLAIISFHSVEDRLVKQAFRSAEQTGLLAFITKRPITPSENELSRNPRSRSAKLRVAAKVQVRC